MYLQKKIYFHSLSYFRSPFLPFARNSHRLSTNSQRTIITLPIKTGQLVRGKTASCILAITAGYSNLMARYGKFIMLQAIKRYDHFILAKGAVSTPDRLKNSGTSKKTVPDNCCTNRSLQPSGNTKCRMMRSGISST